MFSSVECLKWSKNIFSMCSRLIKGFKKYLSFRMILDKLVMSILQQLNWEINLRIKLILSKCLNKFMHFSKSILYWKRKSSKSCKITLNWKFFYCSIHKPLYQNYYFKDLLMKICRSQFEIWEDGRFVNTQKGMFYKAT